MEKMEASEELIAHIKKSEGYRTKAYKCAAGVWTCGWGHTKGVTSRTTCDKKKAEEWLKEDLKPIEAFLGAIRQVNTQGRFDACADFCFNLGVDAFRGSTLLKKIRQGATVAAVQGEFRRWVYAGGKRLEGLVKRREWEAKRWGAGD